MTDHPAYCTAQTYRGTRFEPPEFCEEEVDEPGDLCARHDEDARADEAYERFREDERNGN